jgi:KTSC domain
MERKRVNSSKIRSVGYDERAQTLEIEFGNGEVLQYLRVSHETHRRLMAAPNTAAYFEDNIAEDYTSRRA